MGNSGPLLQLNHVTKRYGSPGAGGTLTVLDNITLTIAAGESLAIVGPSGSGKSTLLNIIGTLDAPSSGEVILEGRNLAQLNEEETAHIRNRQIGFVFQAHYLLPQCTVMENVLVPTLANNKKNAYQEILQENQKREPAKERASRLLGRVGLGGRLSHRPGELSGGERQRVSVVRALINQPAVLLADEPTGALDHLSAQQLGQLLVELNLEEKVTLIVVTHSLELAGRMGRVLELKEGNLKK